jgi:glycosyltransferase involved in cell wall biosynthesis
MPSRTLLVIGDARDDPGSGQARPRPDYEVLQVRLGADILHAGELPRPMGRARAGIALARMAAARADAYDAIYCDSEHIGMPLAFLLRRRPAGPRLTMIAHYLTPVKKRALIRALGLQHRIDGIALHSPAQVARARTMGFRPDQIHHIPYQVDAAFWRPQVGSPADYVASAGQEFRDYRTLIRAAVGLPVDVRIAAGSYWSTRRKNFREDEIPANVRIGRLPYPELRAQYAGARFAVVPLHNVDFQAGIITILESMAMGKAVVVSRTDGQTGVISGPLMDGDVLRDIGEHAWPEQTGIYVPPGDVASLRNAIDYLLDRPEIAQRMGAAARRHVEAELSLDHFVERMASVIAPEVGETVTATGALR